MMQTAIKPGKKWFLIGALTMALGIGGAIALWVGGVVSVTRTVDRFARFDVKGGGTVATLRMPQGGEYVVYYERIGSSTLHSSDIPAGLDVSMAGPDGRQVPFVQDRRDLSFSVHDRTGISVGRLTVPTSGSYKLTAKASGSETFTLAVGKSVGKRLLSYIFGGLAVGFAGFGLGLTMLIVTGVKRGRRKREGATAAVGGYAPVPTSPMWDPAPAYAPPPTWDAAPAPSAWSDVPDPSSAVPPPPPAGWAQAPAPQAPPAAWSPAAPGAEPAAPLWNPPSDTLPTTPASPPWGPPSDTKR